LHKIFSAAEVIFLVFLAEFSTAEAPRYNFTVQYCLAHKHDGFALEILGIGVTITFKLTISRCINYALSP